MDAPRLTRQQDALRIFCICLTGLHVGGAIFYMVQPYAFMQLLNLTTTVIPLEPHPVLTERFWSIMAASMMWMLAACFFLAARDVTRNIGFLKIALVSKGISTPQFLVFFFLEQRSFAMLVGFAADLILFGTILLGYLRAVRSLPRAAAG
jgi:hypothetical protein